jgi:mediator of RNA polymerase II transcription subunit 18
MDNLDKLRGMLKWTDIPDPVPGQPVHIQRKMLEIRNQERLPTILTQNAHMFVLPGRHISFLGGQI